MKYRYMTIDEDGVPYGFNDENLIEDISTYQAVWDLETGEVHANWEGAVKEKIVMKEFTQ